MVLYLGASSDSEDESPLSEDEEEYPNNKDQPHLRFEIKSDDGFSVEADSIEGELLLPQMRFLKLMLCINVIRMFVFSCLEGCY